MGIRGFGFSSDNPRHDAGWGRWNSSRRYMSQYSVSPCSVSDAAMSLRVVFQLVAFCAAGALARVYSDRIYFETDFENQEGAPTTMPPWHMKHEASKPLGAAPSASRFPPPASSVMSQRPAGAGFQPLDTKVDPSPDLAIRTTLAAPEVTTTMKPYTPGLLDQAVNTLTLNMETLLDSGTDVLVFSPLSIAGALTMILLGAGGETLKELAAVLGVKAGVKFAPDGTDMIHEDISNYFRRFEATSINGIVRFANGVFLQDDLLVSDLYVKNVGRLYGSEVQRVNFKPQGMINSMQSINNWVAKRTEGHLKSILSDPLPAETTAVFVNVIYFQGEWEHPFCTDCVRASNFYVSPEETVRVNMMTAVAPAYFNEDKIKGYKILGVPYLNSDLAMYFILPKTNPKQFLEGVQVNDLTAMIQNATMQKEVIYIVPKMRLESTLDLVEPLRKMGLKSMFSPTADLRGVSAGIWINSVLQKVEVEVTETGTRAVVSTIISATRSGHRPSVRLDKPFIFMVYNRALRTTVFWGTVYKPTPYEEMPMRT